MGSSDWLGQVIDNIPNDEIDGFALHSYGGTVSSFMSDLQTQLGVIDSKGLTDRGVYVTEWNRFTPTDQPWLEDNTAQFLRDAYEAVHNWNQTDGNHNIVCMTWFVYDADDQAGNGWDGYSIEYWKDNGWYPQGSSNNLFTAFEQTVDLRYPAGLVGTRGVTADFTADRTRVKPLSPVQFTDESDGTIADWQWNFGDTNTSDQQNPSHSYTQLGTYTVTLTITGNGTDSETKTNYITVRPQPGDFDEDGDVDSTDFGSMQACLTGSGIQQSDPQCSQALIDGDTDADANDVALFVGCFTGPNQSASDTCAGQW
jgi:PKD repeat protein